jgi:hypothetical protein
MMDSRISLTTKYIRASFQRPQHNQHYVYGDSRNSARLDATQIGAHRDVLRRPGAVLLTLHRDFLYMVHYRRIMAQLCRISMEFEKHSNIENLERVENIGATMEPGRLASHTPSV